MLRSTHFYQGDKNSIAIEMKIILIHIIIQFVVKSLALLL